MWTEREKETVAVVGILAVAAWLVWRKRQQGERDFSAQGIPHRVGIQSTSMWDPRFYDYPAGVDIY
jgi:hypothetical protein